MEIGHLRKDILLFWIGCEVWVLVPGKKYLETGVILESEFCMVQNPCLSKSHTKFGLQDHPCFRILLAWFLQEFQFNPYAVGTISWQGSASNCDSRLYLPFLYHRCHTQLPMLIYEYPEYSVRVECQELDQQFPWIFGLCKLGIQVLYHRTITISIHFNKASASRMICSQQPYP